MIVRLIWIFILLLAAVFIGIQLNRDPGYLFISINEWTLETTLWFALLVCLIVFLIFHVFFTLISKITHIPAWFRQWRAKKRTLNAQNKTRQGLIEFSEGYWSQAKNHLIKALP